MKTVKLFTLLLTISLFACYTAMAVINERELSSFSEISLRIPGTVHLNQGNTQSISIKASESTLEEIITEVKDRTLIIRFKNNNFFWRTFNPGKIDIYISVPEIDALFVAGSGNIKGTSIDTRILDLAVSGSGDISVGQVNCERMKVAISGSGNINLNSGRTIDLNAAISGSGNFRGADFAADNVDTRISGSGNCTITAHKVLTAKVSGSGSVVYKGNPQLDSAVSGSGRIKKL
ncbi:MAG TPA: head GIN domain-containing protein [Mariniphaga sp.]|nr:head GIN domain-containing protein [Mariniphaga sp.]